MLPVPVPAVILSPYIAMLEGAGLDVGLEGPGLVPLDKLLNGAFRNCLNFSRFLGGILSQEVSCGAYVMIINSHLSYLLAGGINSWFAMMGCCDSKIWGLLFWGFEMARNGTMLMVSSLRCPPQNEGLKKANTLAEPCWKYRYCTSPMHANAREARWSNISIS